MHICMISGGLQPILPNRRGAIEPYIYRLSKKLSETNHVDIFGVGNGELIENNLHIHTLPYVETFQNSLRKVMDWRIASFAPYNVYVLKEIIRLHRKNPIDILHIHEVYSGFAATISKLTLGIPFVCSIHNEIRKTTPILASNKFLANSQYIQNFLINKQKINKNKIEILHIAVDTSKKANKNIEEIKKKLNLHHKKIILFVGRKCPDKGPMVLIKAVKSIVKKYPDILCILIGPDFFFGSELVSYTNFLKNAIKKYELEKNFMLKGYVNDEELDFYFTIADIFVCPSVWNEPFGVVLLEALSYGKPVIASQVGGIPEIIIDRKTGLLTQPGNHLEIAKALELLLDDYELCKRLSSAGKNLVKSCFNFETVGNRCLEIYQKVILSSNF